MVSSKTVEKKADKIQSHAESFVDRLVELSKEYLAQASEVKDHLVERAPEHLDDAKDLLGAGLGAATTYLARRRRFPVGPVALTLAGVGVAALIYSNREKVKAAAVAAKDKAAPAFRSAQEALQSKMATLSETSSNNTAEEALSH